MLIIKMFVIHVRLNYCGIIKYRSSALKVGNGVPLTHYTQFNCDKLIRHGCKSGLTHKRN